MIIKVFLKCRRAATAIEYALIVALIAIVMMGGLRLLGGGTDGLWTKVVDTISPELQI